MGQSTFSKASPTSVHHQCTINKPQGADPDENFTVGGHGKVLTRHQNNNPETQDRVLRFPRPWLFDVKLSPRALALACAIVQWTLPSNRGGFCFYSARKLGELLGWSRPTVERALADLRAADILETARRGRRIVAPVMASSINGDGPKMGNSINADGTLNEPRRSRHNLGLSKAKREGNASSKDRHQALSRNSRDRVENESNEPSQANPTESAQVETTRAKSKSATSEATTLTGEIVAEFNRQAEDHGIAKREKATPELARAVSATGETLEELRRGVVGVFAENTDHRDDEQRLWFLKQGYGIRSAIKRLETRDRLRAFAPFEQDKARAGLDDGDRKTVCAESNAGAHAPGALKKREDGRFACGFACGFNKSADVRAYELRASNCERALMDGFVRWDSSASEVRFEKTGRGRLRKKLDKVALAEGLAPLADAEIQRGWGTLNGHLIGSPHKTEGNILPAFVLNWFQNELRSQYRRKRSEPAGYQGIRDFFATEMARGDTDEPIDRLAELFGAPEDENETYSGSLDELFGLPSGERKPA